VPGACHHPPSENYKSGTISKVLHSEKPNFGLPEYRPPGVGRNLFGYRKLVEFV